MYRHDSRAPIVASVLLGLLCVLGGVARSQQPFVTDDADVVGKGKFELEMLAEFDRLHRSQYPETYQNLSLVELSYGLTKNIEISLEGQFVGLESRERPRLVGSIGDTTVEVKYNFRHEKDPSYLPAMAIICFVQAPTGDVSRGLGSGVTDFGINAIAQKSIGKHDTFRINGGYLFAGNTIVGNLGISSVRGHIFTGSSSYVRRFTDKLYLGADLSGAVTSKFQLSEGQLQVRLGGNYHLGDKTTFDFGVAVGKYSASPRFGIVLGFTRTF